MKEIKNKILDCLANENFNNELVGYKVKLQNKINKLQKLIDVINVLQPLEDEFVLPEKWCVKVNKKNKCILNKYMLDCKHIYMNFKEHWIVEPEEDCKMYFLKPLERSFHSSNNIKGYTEITFEKFKKHVLKC